MQEFMIGLVNDFGYLGIFLLILIENIFPPIPSEAVLLFGGAMTVGSAMNIPFTVIFATLGAVAGAIVLYMLGRIFQKNRLKKLFSGKFGKIMHLKPEYVDKAGNWFGRYQNRAVLLCRCIPVVRSLISIPAGIAKMNFPLFLVLTTIGSTVWNTLLVCLGAFLGTAWESAIPYFDNYSHIALAVITIGFVGFVCWKIFKRRKRRNSKKN